MIDTVLALLTAGLNLWLNEEKTKYVDHKISLEKQYYEEYNKPIGERSDAVLDNLVFQLRILASAFVTASSGKQDPPNQS